MEMPCSATSLERLTDAGTRPLISVQPDDGCCDEAQRLDDKAYLIRRTAVQNGYGAGLLLKQLQGQLTERDQNWDDLKPIIVAACQRDEREAGRLMVELVERMSQQLAEGA